MSPITNFFNSKDINKIIFVNDMRSFLYIVICYCGLYSRIKACISGKGTNKKRDSVRESVVPQHAKVYGKYFSGNRGERMHRICSSDSLNNPNASESMSEIAVHPWRANETTSSNRAYGAQQGASGSYNTASSGRNSQSRIRCEVATAREGDYDNLSRSRLYQSATDKSILSRVDEEPAQNLRQHEHEIPEEASNRCETGKKRDDMGTMCKNCHQRSAYCTIFTQKKGEPLIETTRQNKTPIKSTCDDELQTLQALQRRIDQKMRSLEEEINSIHSKLDRRKKNDKRM
ncbi:hypothetical protein VCUG_00214 [Vavraia culicis subsp. floridensis]|uniref:Uncharacterized protein n=1 Tax=Vavraia culicis (isolate floridensis) TaxID=948595 RepID=L2GYP4_VAVCU|nr:uncharacterized protein VCUG_00214 [Vavraia culicis subsp. floridensis]ELA48378.1 hypothetical protein VCUG_00214 [Vavraia culicis subsp. floridensis]